MEKNIQIFTSDVFGEVRTMTNEKGETFFVGKDVATALGYAAPRNAIATHVDKEDKKDALIQCPLGGTQKMTIINESGLYALILSSKLEQANQYRPDFCGIVVNNGAANPSTVAAEGYKVTRTEVSATSPYSYAWTYTVEPIN